MSGPWIERSVSGRASSLLLLAAASALASCGRGPGPASIGSASYRAAAQELVYHSVGDRELRLDFYAAPGSAPAPALIFLHGGKWMKGIKENVPADVRSLAEDLGAAVVSVEYRLAPAAQFPAPAEDCTRAVQFVRHEAERLGIDERRIALVGVSAGGHLALWVGLHDDLARPDSLDPIERESSRVAAIVNFYGPTDLHLVTRVGHDEGDYRGLLGLEPGECFDAVPEATIEAVSPVTFVSPDDPPVLTCHGTEDDSVPFDHAVALDRVLRSKGCESRLLPIEGAHHGWPRERTPLDEIRDFVHRHLGG